jgi:hypothetical protein
MAQTLTRKAIMPARRRGQAGGAGEKATLKVRKDLARKARAVAALRDVDLFDYVDSILTPAVERDYVKAVEEESRAAESQVDVETKKGK